MRRINILGIVILVVVALWSGAWFYASTVIRQNITTLASGDSQAAPTLTCDRVDIGGYPFWFDVTCTGMTAASGDLTASVPSLKAELLVTDPFHAVLTATSPLTLEDAFTGSKERLDWQSLEASARLTDWRIARISIVADGPALTATTGDDLPLAKATHAEFHLLDMPAQHDAARHLAGLALYAKLDGLVAPGAQLTGAVSTLEADITGLPDDVRTYGDPDLLKRWQASGGKVKLVGFKGNDGPQNFDVTGDLALDAAARPQGQLEINSKGLVERFGNLVPEQWRPLVLGSPGPDGSYSQVLNLTNGLILSGVLPVGTIPPLF